MKLKTYQEHLNKIEVENKDFAEVIKKYDSPTTFFYVDPPYKNFERLYSNHNFFGRNEHIRLQGTLNTIQGMFALSYYRFPELDELYPPDFFDYHEQEFSKSAGAVKGKKMEQATELLITNYTVKKTVDKFYKATKN